MAAHVEDTLLENPTLVTEVLPLQKKKIENLPYEKTKAGFVGYSI